MSVSSTSSRAPRTKSSMGKILEEGQGDEKNDPSVEEEVVEESLRKGSNENARLLLRLCQVLSCKIVALNIRQAQLAAARDEWLKEKHRREEEEERWRMRYLLDDRVVQGKLEALQVKQSNDVDSASIVYDAEFERERQQLYSKAELVIDLTLELMVALYGESHPAVTDTIMMMVAMLLDRGQVALALPLLVASWQTRTSPYASERLQLGHPRELECSLFHIGTRMFVEGNISGAQHLLRHLHFQEERHARNLQHVRTVLWLCSLRLRSPSEQHEHEREHEVRLLLAGNVIDRSDSVRPVSLEGMALLKSQAEADQSREVEMPANAWEILSQALRTNRCMQVLNISSCRIGKEEVRYLVSGLRDNKSVHSLDMSNNRIGVEGSQFLKEMLQHNGTIADLDLSGNELRDKGISNVAEGMLANKSTRGAMRRLVLADNSFSTDGARAMSTCLSHSSTSVALLDVSRNPVGCSGVSFIADAIFHGCPLTTLIADNCKIGNEGMLRMAEAIEGTTSLLSLSLANEKEEIHKQRVDRNIFDDVAVSVLTDAIAKSRSLTSIDLSGNSVSSRALLPLSEALRSVNGVRDVQASTSSSLPPPSASSSAFEHISSAWEHPDALRGSPGAVRCLKLRRCPLDPLAAQHLAHMLERNPALLGLDLSGSPILGAGIAEIAASMGGDPDVRRARNTRLTSLSVGSCQLHAGGAVHVARMLLSNNHLRRLDLSDNKIGTRGAVELAAALHHNFALTELQLGKNEIGDEGCLAVGRSLSANLALRRLDLSDNRIGDAGARALCLGLLTNISLSELNLKGNELSCIGVGFLEIAVRSKLLRRSRDRQLRVVGLPSHEGMREAAAKSTTGSEFGLMERLKHMYLTENFHQESYRRGLRMTPSQISLHA